ncbi:hypothetical protein ACQUQP_12125 [Marinobacterium sp. YM272]|uniref:hypothetical protein n=1 Tax=Marinobacterium sp. YM272 TaxID=3421654 RepID=UPI003D7FFDA0
MNSIKSLKMVAFSLLMAATSVNLLSAGLAAFSKAGVSPESLDITGRNTQAALTNTLFADASVSDQHGVNGMAIARIPEKLVGIVGAGKNRVAILQLGSADPNVYRAGDQISDQIFIDEILPFDLVLNDAGVLRRLPLRQFADEPERVSAKPSVEMSADKDIAKATDQFVALSKTADGFEALAIQSVPDALSGFDLKPGDNILQINGIDAALVYREPIDYVSMLSENSLQLTVERDGGNYTAQVRTSDFMRFLNQFTR